MEKFKIWIKAREENLLVLKGTPLAQSEFGDMINIELVKVFDAIDLIEEYEDYIAGCELKGWGDKVTITKLQGGGLEG